MIIAPVLCKFVIRFFLKGEKKPICSNEQNYTVLNKLVVVLSCGRASAFRSRGPAAVSKLRQFRSPLVFRKRQKAVDPFYLVSIPWEVKDPTQGNGKNWTHIIMVSILNLPCSHVCMHGARQ